MRMALPEVTQKEQKLPLVFPHSERRPFVVLCYEYLLRYIHALLFVADRYLEGIHQRRVQVIMVNQMDGMLNKLNWLRQEQDYLWYHLLHRYFINCYSESVFWRNLKVLMVILLCIIFHLHGVWIRH